MCVAAGLCYRYNKQEVYVYIYVDCIATHLGNLRDRLT